MCQLPKVSVLIPTYNSAGYLDETIKSVLGQTFTDFELLIVDNCSTDDTKSVVAKYLHDHRIHYILNEQNIGMCGNWNRSLSYAKGKYIKYLMSDDKFHLQLLEKFVAVMEEFPSVSLVSSYKTIFGTENWNFKSPLSGLQPGLEAIEHSVLTHNWIGEPTTVMFRKESARVGSFKSDLHYYMDFDLWLRILKTGDLYVVPEYLSSFRVHSAQATEGIKQSHVDSFEPYYYLNFLYDFNFAGFVNELPFKLAKQRAAQKCVNLIPSLRTANNVALLERAREIGRRENVKPPTVLDRAVSKLKRYVSK